MSNMIIKNGKSYELDESSVTNMKFLYEEDFIDAYSDSDDEFIQYIINGMVDSYITNIVSIMDNLAFDLNVLLIEENIESEGYYNILSNDIYNNYQYLKSYYDSYIDGYSKIWWDRIGTDFEYWWNKVSKEYNLPDLKTILSENYIINIIKEAKNNVCSQ